MNKKLLILIIVILCAVILIIYKELKKDDLNNTRWQLTSWSVSSISPSITNITLEFNKNKISGNGGVNNYGGDYKTSSSKLFISNLQSTEMASPDPNINIAETTYFNLLKDVKYYIISLNKLTLLDKNNNEILVYEKK